MKTTLLLISSVLALAIHHHAPIDAHSLEHAHSSLLRRHNTSPHHHHHHHHKHPAQSPGKGISLPRDLSGGESGDVSGYSGISSATSGAGHPGSTTQTPNHPKSTLQSYFVQGLGKRKGELIEHGATDTDLSIALLESEHLTPAINADGKTGDSANWGVFNQNWYMLRTTTSYFAGLKMEDWKRGEELNTDLALDITCLHESMAAVGEENFMKGQRNGQTGIQTNSMSDDIQNYYHAILAIAEWVPDHRHDDLRPIYYVQHI